MRTRFSHLQNEDKLHWWLVDNIHLYMCSIYYAFCVGYFQNEEMIHKNRTSGKKEERRKKEKGGKGSLPFPGFLQQVVRGRSD